VWGLALAKGQDKKPITAGRENDLVRYPLEGGEASFYVPGELKVVCEE
jgi:hypothetical protein